MEIYLKLFEVLFPVFFVVGIGYYLGKNNPKLESFVYKRVHYKMDRLEYNIESEDISDISFSVKSSFMDYGLNITFDKNISSNERLSFNLIFYTYDELKKENIYSKKEDNDEFVILKQSYNNSDIDNKQIIISEIIDYIVQTSEKCFYYNKQNLKVSYANKFYYYLDNNHEELEKICVNFHSTNQIKTWLSKTLDDMYNDIDLVNIFQVSQIDGLSKSPLSLIKYGSIKRFSMSNNNNSIV